MNEWVEKSIAIAAEPSYLDRLHAVYPMEAGAFREIPQATLGKLKTLVKTGDKKELIRTLLWDKNLKLFPIKDSYVAFLRKNKLALDLNPQTVERIGNRLVKMGYEEIVERCIQPKETNRQIGPLFQRWLPKLGYPMVSQEEFLSPNKVCFLAGTDKSLKDFSNKHFGTKLKKGLDLIFKAKNTFVIGEAKFLTDFGGHQNAQFNDPHSLMQVRGNKLVKIAVLDGVIWLPTKNKMHMGVKQSNGIALSALLLRDFIESL